MSEKEQEPEAHRFQLRRTGSDGTTFDAQIDHQSQAILQVLNAPGITVGVGIEALLAAFLTLTLKTAFASTDLRLEERIGVLQMATIRGKDVVTYLYQWRQRIEAEGMGAVDAYLEEIQALRTDGSPKERIIL